MFGKETTNFLQFTPNFNGNYCFSLKSVEIFPKKKKSLKSIHLNKQKNRNTAQTGFKTTEKKLQLEETANIFKYQIDGTKKIWSC